MERKLIHCSGCLLSRAVAFHTGSIRTLSLTAPKYNLKHSHYDILGVNKKASSDQIRAAFVKLSKEIHPDKHPDDPKFHDKFVRLNEAYTVLSKPLSKREYDTSLAHRLYQHDSMAHHGYSSHTAAETHHPGSGTARGQSDDASQRVFWDETIWYMRDKSKDKNAFYSEDQYYGIKGVQRLPNSYIVGGCFFIIFLGTVTFFLAANWSGRKRKEWLDNMQRKNMAILAEAKASALRNGNAKQIEILAAKIEAEHKRREKLHSKD